MARRNYENGCSRRDNHYFNEGNRETRRMMVLAAGATYGTIDSEWLVSALQNWVRIPRRFRALAAVVFNENLHEMASMVGAYCEQPREKFDPSYRHPQAIRRES